MDKFDNAILSALRSDARRSISDIAAAVNLSRSAVTERIKKMESSGTIRGYQVILSASQTDGVSAYFEIQHKCPNCADIVKIFHTIPEIITCKGITGDMDLLIYATAASMKRLHEIREFIDAQDDITKIKTHVVMSEWIDNQG
ncbi:AsnC family transcriptional regulator [Shewanella sp. Choline-02u-19]|uniref:Lrp/AsnC family transcriptional regulator n=1 Tax=unclassified Shewanella TaxID=196818 RepID=UPI000C34B71F|nr:MULTISPECIES: Lrp/AsnC family transcriptional regulator [unclassified Shewanella]PKG72760.1 AsnC family transcriptional regulator [Shewanella sp. GutCb]PKH57187.1 AsnC family transcriptional regulator [Shewanella sp. Bg11-22]PKI29698.1 AsnC family transcriptional regulator [Shewanella sp. Choline-02u-19]